MMNVVYLNDNDEIVSPELSTKSIVRECDENGNLIRETFMFKKNDNVNKPIVKRELTEEDKAFLRTFEKDGKKTFNL